MAVNALSKVTFELSDLPVKNPDGSPMLQDDGSPVTATMFGPGSKIWQAADAAMRRKTMRRVRENGGKIEAAAADDTEDRVEFLCAVTKRFNGIEIPGEAEQVRAIYSNPLLGFIRDHLYDDGRNWENFTRPSSVNAASTPSNLPG